jgi:hypothetical protein
MEVICQNEARNLSIKRDFLSEFHGEHQTATKRDLDRCYVRIRPSKPHDAWESPRFEHTRLSDMLSTMHSRSGTATVLVSGFPIDAPSRSHPIFNIRGLTIYLLDLVSNRGEINVS